MCKGIYKKERYENKKIYQMDDMCAGCDVSLLGM